MRAPELDAPGTARRWAGAAALAISAHALVITGVLLWSRTASPPEAEPIVMVELPEGAPAASSDATRQEQPSQDAPRPTMASTTPQAIAPLQEIPVEPMPRDPLPVALRPMPAPAPVSLSAPQPSQASPSPAVASTPPAPARSVSQGAGTSGDGPGTSPKARKAQQDYFAMIAAHLQRKKSYPKEAKQARQQGTVTVRFTVARDGTVSAISIKRSSGHDLLDTATLDLLRRVAPLPRMPSSMERDSVTLSLPIDYSLRTD